MDEMNQRDLGKSNRAGSFSCGCRDEPHSLSRADEGSEDRSNIILIGMPGSGKSTIGVILAKMTSRDFVDTDVVIQTSENRSLQDIVDQDGYMALRRIEEKILLALNLRNHVIATGGSAVYSPSAIAHLKSKGIAIFLDVDLPTLESRIHDFGSRGLAKRPDQSLADLFQERLLLYRKYADITIECKDLAHEEVCAEIINRLRGRKTETPQAKK